MQCYTDGNICTSRKQKFDYNKDKKNVHVAFLCMNVYGFQILYYRSYTIKSVKGCEIFFHVYKIWDTFKKHLRKCSIYLFILVISFILFDNTTTKQNSYK